MTFKNQRYFKSLKTFKDFDALENRIKLETIRNFLRVEFIFEYDELATGSCVAFLPELPNSPGISLRRDLLLATKAKRQEKRVGGEQEGNVINWLHDKTALVPRSPVLQPDPPWLRPKIWSHATWKRACTSPCWRSRDKTFAKKERKIIEARFLNAISPSNEIASLKEFRGIRRKRPVAVKRCFVG